MTYLSERAARAYRKLVPDNDLLERPPLAIASLTVAARR